MRAKKYNMGGVNDPKKKKKEGEYLPRMVKQGTGLAAIEELEKQIEAAKKAGDMDKVKELVQKHRAMTASKKN